MPTKLKKYEWGGGGLVENNSLKRKIYKLNNQLEEEKEINLM